VTDRSAGSGPLRGAVGSALVVKDSARVVQRTNRFVEQPIAQAADKLIQRRNFGL